MKSLEYILIFFIVSGCASNFLKYEKQEAFFKPNDEFDRQVQIKTEGDENESEPSESATTQSALVQSVTEPPKSQIKKNPIKQTEKVIVEKTADKLTDKSADKKKSTPLDKKNAEQKVSSKIKIDKSVPEKGTAIVSAPQRREPSIEDAEGFMPGSRRPLIDPFVPGEKVVHAVKYFTAEAGKLTMQVKPYAQVNGRQSYHFVVGLKSSRLFSNFYSVDDQVETFLDYETIVPHVLKVNIKETGKLAQSRSYFNQATSKASFWEKKYTEKDGEQERKYDWDILPFSQNAFSGVFYMRIFTWKVGKEISYRVAEDQKNVVFKGTAIAREKIETEAGVFDAYKIKASIMSRGALSQTGDIFIWISDDNRKYILRIEAKIKIGSLISEVVEIDHGKRE